MQNHGHNTMEGKGKVQLMVKLKFNQEQGTKAQRGVDVQLHCL
jgi:hypothetical protein